MPPSMVTRNAHRSFARNSSITITTVQLFVVNNIAFLVVEMAQVGNLGHDDHLIGLMRDTTWWLLVMVVRWGVRESATTAQWSGGVTCAAARSGGALMLIQAKQGGTIGIVALTFMYEPLRDEECDRQAVNRALAFVIGW
ncbi:glycoside hydrolase family 1 protein [Sesbania bispinosa]|nr:glycoside hydrolase family 1 protein [Sesbania bispinosa]